MELERYFLDWFSKIVLDCDNYESGTTHALFRSLFKKCAGTFLKSIRRNVSIIIRNPAKIDVILDWLLIEIRQLLIRMIAKPQIFRLGFMLQKMSWTVHLCPANWHLILVLDHFRIWLRIRPSPRQLLMNWNKDCGFLVEPDLYLWILRFIMPISICFVLSSKFWEIQFFPISSGFCNFF